jgi:hypothetical protein
LLASAPLAVIPRIETTAEKLRRGLRWRKAAFGLAGALVCGVIAAHFLYRPLDVLWFSVLRRLGV